VKVIPPTPIAFGPIVIAGFSLGGFALLGAACDKQALPVARPAPT